ncbi:MAG: fibrillarin [Promethearchaeota archaeon CR_4]|nr:MAG: fibrillarin [Candidatus Lokiarchaeota archaeon CR_4]
MSPNLLSHKFEGIFADPNRSDKLYTINLVPGVYMRDEKTFNEGGMEYREWNPYRSKLAAAILRGMKIMPVQARKTGLYLGASSGTTVSHVSDIIGEGIVYAVEFAPRSLRELIQNCEGRYNVIPLLGDATLPAQYRQKILSLVDFLYQDVAQPFQAKILVDNAKFFLKDQGLAFLAIKSRSIDVTEEPEKIYQKETDFLKQNNFVILETLTLDPFSADHAVIVAKYLRK